MGVFAVVLVVALLFNALVGTGIFMRSRTAAETDDFEINGAVMSYYIYSAYSSYVDYWTNYYQQYFGTSVSASALIGIDGNVSLKKQIYDEKTGETWFQYFAKQAAEQVEEILVYCQATWRETSFKSSFSSRSRRLREVTYLPSLPAKGESLTAKVISMVGSEIFTKGSGS